ncbi:MAG: hypothetical protein PHI53_01950 [Candidatus Pacebacteria bacterium]|nr:hypothetical protein [Candidatus Paceibacterota bacterium]
MFQVLNGNKINKGFSIIEMMIVVGIIILAFIAILSAVAFFLKNSVSIKMNNQANELAQEAIEAVRSFRKQTQWSINGLGSLNTSDSYYYHPELKFQSTGGFYYWDLVPGIETIEVFSRKIMFRKVSRNPINQTIEQTYNPSNDDPNTRKVIVSVSWGNNNLELITYFTNWKK